MRKARVAPTKLTTIPRLELSSAVTSVRIGDVLKRELKILNLHEYYWTDSEVVLGNVNNDAKRFHIFVVNRIQRIRSSTNPEQPSALQTVDQTSRGLNAVQLKESNWSLAEKSSTSSEDCRENCGDRPWASEVPRLYSQDQGNESNSKPLNKILWLV